MKKLLLTLVSVLAFTSAVANTNNTDSVNDKTINDSINSNVQMAEFVLKKAPLNLNVLNIENQMVAIGGSCETDCVNSFRNCQAAGNSWCFRALTQCIDTCEGAGGLYN